MQLKLCVSSIQMDCFFKIVFFLVIFPAVHMQATLYVGEFLVPENRKQLKRIFPCDDRTVLVIDDRSDVWQYSRNLVPVSPYSFFIGIGDVNWNGNSQEQRNRIEGVEDHVASPVPADNDTELVQIQKVFS